MSDPKDIIQAQGNIVVCASAGTGKTTTLVNKIAYELENTVSHRTIAAITFTRKAAQEIRDRLTIDTHGAFIGTNNYFVIEEIIRPFTKDVYGNDFLGDFSTDYSIKKDSFNECLYYLRYHHTLCSYCDKKKNFVFELAYKILENSYACRRYLKAKYFMIFVDEYQDCDISMHNLFLFICNQLNIRLFVVGDKKQSIYGWRGAYSNVFDDLISRKNFNFYELVVNYRSSTMLQNFSNLLFSETKDNYVNDGDKNDIILINSYSTSWVKDISKHLNLDASCALLRFKNEDVKRAVDEINYSGNFFTYVPSPPINEITSDASWFYYALAQYFIVPRYSLFSFMNDIPEEVFHVLVEDGKLLKLLEIKTSIIENALKQNNEPVILEEVRGLASALGYSVSDDNTKKLIKTINNEEFHTAFRIEELNHVGMTIHSSKGLEYDQIIVFANDFQLNSKDSINLHYVAVTRAKTKLIIVKLNDVEATNGQQYIRYLECILKTNGHTLNEVLTTYNCLN